ncbi:TetR/AcrR family transcriptional regulator [Ruania albidiflava]|uniref:TetR/AcrR family transcriptional regulator n=1 Tax=Ruania albidiflava TaxID=366586 RepID=UPI0003B6115B|nr:TetR/AcrR family transcriptional regulator [Ruania albidiflava]
MRGKADLPEARGKILDAAVTLFARHGFDGTSTARIAHTAGVPKGLLFYYFSTKATILTALLDERLVVAPFDSATLAVRGDTEQTLMNVGERILADHAESEVLREIVWHEAHTRPEVLTVLTRYRQALHDSIERVLRASLVEWAGADAIRAAAAAWAAVTTARPLPRDEDGTAAEHAGADLRAVARLLAGVCGPRRHCRAGSIPDCAPPGTARRSVAPTEAHVRDRGRCQFARTAATCSSSALVRDQCASNTRYAPAASSTSPANASTPAGSRVRARSTSRAITFPEPSAPGRPTSTCAEALL